MYIYLCIYIYVYIDVYVYKFKEAFTRLDRSGRGRLS